jgi:hypothetical protein
VDQGDSDKQPEDMELPNIRVHGDHTAEEVIAAAMGAG